MSTDLAIDSFSGVARFSVGDLAPAPRLRLLPTPEPVSESDAQSWRYHCIDLQELAEALQLHFDGTLNYVDPWRVNEPLTLIVPGKPLLSVLESAEIDIALNAIALLDRIALETMHSFDTKIYNTDLDYVGAINRLAAALWGML
ncbi:MAG: hypothetical protein U5M23_00250 [Marinagarivorans sp.]|nr:hypothetical protein [Marinagarivorans sp.]